MKPKRLIARSQANGDIQEAVDYHLNEGSAQAAPAFIDAIEQAFRHIGRHPASGSARYAHELGLPDLRCWPVKRYPYLVLYVERDDHVDVWRVLHAQRDIPAWLRESG